VQVLACMPPIATRTNQQILDLDLKKLRIRLYKLIPNIKEPSSLSFQSCVILKKLRV
jgi:hypothetical protein